MESLSPFLWRTCTSCNMPVYPGAQWMVVNPHRTPVFKLGTLNECQTYLTRKRAHAKLVDVKFI